MAKPTVKLTLPVLNSGVSRSVKGPPSNVGIGEVILNDMKRKEKAGYLVFHVRESYKVQGRD